MAPCSEQHGVTSELSGSNQPDLRLIGRHGTKKRHSFVEGRAAAGLITPEQLGDLGRPV